MCDSGSACRDTSPGRAGTTLGKADPAKLTKLRGYHNRRRTVTHEHFDGFNLAHPPNTPTDDTASTHRNRFTGFPPRVNQSAPPNQPRLIPHKTAKYDLKELPNAAFSTQPGRRRAPVARRNSTPSQVAEVVIGVRSRGVTQRRQSCSAAAPIRPSLRAQNLGRNAPATHLDRRRRH